MSDRFAPPPSVFGLSRNVVIASGVVLFHAAALWALQSGLLRRAAEVVIPIEIMSQFVEPPKPKVDPPPPPPPPPKATKSPPPPRPQAIREPKPTPAPSAPIGTTEPPPPPAPPAPEPAPPAPPSPPPAPPAAPKVVEITAAQAQWLRKPAPRRPTLSDRLGEYGTVVIAVYFTRNGTVRRTEIQKSSGYDRLDKAARDAVALSSLTVSQHPNASEDTLFMLPASIIFDQPK